ncbi:MAG: transcription antitermination factor NusB [Fibrobacteraceae bacterium]|nr:transcription antitermination factor NusB [Fibrobacteraceae bacterium]
MQKYSVNRRSARVFAMQLLYAMEVTAGTAGECLGGVLNNSPELSSEMKAYGISLVDIAQEHREDFEKIIAETSKSWAIERMALVDVCVLRVALAELLYKADTPAKVVLTEAVQIAAKYSTEDSYSFINGILNHVAEMQGIFPSTTKESL